MVTANTYPAAMDLLDSVIIEPSATHTGSVIWLHGLGASGHDFEPVIPWLRRPDLRFVLPHAPYRPVTINNGYVMPSWYDIRTLAAGPEREDTAQIAESTELVRALIAAEVAAGIPTERIALIGFSQGAAMTLHTGLRHESPLAGLAVLSGYLLLEDTIKGEATHANRSTPLLFCHGTRDDVVKVERGRRAHRWMTDDGRPTEWHDWPMGHEVVPDQIEVIGQWLGRVLSPRSGT
jgi:phospholipase/carboxylesterase